MKDQIIVEAADGTKESYFGGKEFVDSVAHAASKEELRTLLQRGGIYMFSEEELEESYKNLALSQDWDTIQDLFQDKNFESCKRKLEAWGLTTSEEHFELINDVIATASDEDLARALLKETSMESTLETLHRHGYYHMTAEFLNLVHENAVHLHEDALLTREELRELSGKDFYERCHKSINLMFALSSIAGLALGVSGTADPALLIAIAGGISLLFGKQEPEADQE